MNVDKTTAKSPCVTFTAEKTIRVSRPSLSIENDTLTLRAKVSGGAQGTCFFATPLENRDFVDENSSDCFLMGLLFTAMSMGCDLELKGCVSEKLLFHTRHFLIPMLDGFFEGELQPVEIRAESVRQTAYDEADAVGTGLSGGIDSFHTIKEFYQDYTGPAADRINTLLFFNVGSHGMGNDISRLQWLEQKFHERNRKLAALAEELGLPLITVNSNVHAFIRSGHLQTSDLASLSATLFLGKKLRLYYLASAGINYRSLMYGTSAKAQQHDIEKINEYILPHACTESFTAMSGGAALTRTQKTELICRDALVRKYLDVCGNQNAVVGNCSCCFKCRRTMLTLDILGLLDQFGGVFDLSKFDARERKRYIASLLNNRSSDLLWQDIYDFAQRKHYDLNGRTTWAARCYMRFTETALYSFLRKWLKRK